MAYLGDCEAEELWPCPQVVVVAGNDSKHERADQEALNLDPATTKDLDKCNCKEVPRHVARGSDNQVSISVLQKRVIFRLAFGESDGSQYDGLIEIETIKGNVNEEPARCSTNQLL